MRALYLIAGTDGAKIDATRSRLRARAEREAGAAALEVFEPGEGKGMPDHEALLTAIPAMSLMDSRRYLLADGVERWRDRQLEAVAAAIAELPPDLTVVLIARAKAPAKLTRAVKAAKGEIHEFEAPKAREMPRLLVAEAQRLGFRRAIVPTDSGYLRSDRSMRLAVVDDYGPLPEVREVPDVRTAIAVALGWKTSA